jgi:16S rRNA (adenine1518-N6/adenine1519-N6)-dimethyltransferase
MKYYNNKTNDSKLKNSHTGCGNFRAKKSLGQNFLKSQPALKMMCEAGEVNEKDFILEIGPGKGALTEKLLERAGTVLAIEKDRDLFEFLQEKFQDEIKNKKLILVEGDVLIFDFASVIFNFCSGPRTREDKGPDHSQKLKLPTQHNYKIIANIPYNITGAIIKKFLSCDIQPEKMVFLVQKEVAERIVARDGKESILSLSVKAYGIPKYEMKVSKRFFSPSPKVDSSIISINNISKKNFADFADEKNFFKIIKAGFAHKRKVLLKNLENIMVSPNSHTGCGNWGKGKVGEVFEKLGINPKTRAEDVDFEKWLQISRNLSTGM